MFRHAPPPRQEPDKPTAAIMKRIEALAAIDPDSASLRRRQESIAALHNLYWQVSTLWEDSMARAQEGPRDRKLSLNDMRDLTGMSRSTVQQYIQRARERLHPEEHP